MAEVWWWEKGIEYDLEAVVEDFGDDSGQERAANLQARVRIDLDQVQAEVLIKHEVVTEKLQNETNKHNYINRWYELSGVYLPRRCCGDAAGLSYERPPCRCPRSVSRSRGKCLGGSQSRARVAAWRSLLWSLASWACFHFQIYRSHPLSAK